MFTSCYFLYLISIHQDLYCNTRAAFQDVTQSGEGSASTLLCDPNKLGTWWYPALWCWKVVWEFTGTPAYPALKEPKGLPLWQRRKSCKPHWLVLEVLLVFLFLFWSQSTCGSWNNKLTSGFLAPILTLTKRKSIVALLQCMAFAGFGDFTSISMVFIFLSAIQLLLCQSKEESWSVFNAILLEITSQQQHTAFWWMPFFWANMLFYFPICKNSFE